MLSNVKSMGYTAALRTNNIVHFLLVVMVFFQQNYDLHYENMPMQYTAIFHGYNAMMFR